MKVKLIIAGTRTFNDYELLEKEVDDFMNLSKEDVIIVMSGFAKGADELGERWAHKRGHVVFYYPANWEEYGKRAGPIRNKRMADHATHCICFWDGKSRGTKNMIDLSISCGLELKIVNYKLNEGKGG